MTPSTEAGRALMDAEAPEYESNPCKHEGETWFNRTFCACGSMHDVCVECTHAIGCPLDRPEAFAERRKQAASPILAIEAEARAAALADLAKQVEGLPNVWTANATIAVDAVSRAAVLRLISEMKGVE